MKYSLWCVCVCVCVCVYVVWCVCMCVCVEQRLRWLGHVGRMDEERLPNRSLFGELNMKRPCHGAKKR